MHKIFCRVIAAAAIMCCLCLSAGAVETEWIDVSYDSHKVNLTTILRASGSFDKSLKPYSTMLVQKAEPLIRPLRFQREETIDWELRTILVEQ